METRKETEKERKMFVVTLRANVIQHKMPDLLQPFHTIARFGLN
jgi:hypothetical protein